MGFPRVGVEFVVGFFERGEGFWFVGVGFDDDLAGVVFFDVGIKFA